MGTLDLDLCLGIGGCPRLGREGGQRVARRAVRGQEAAQASEKESSEDFLIWKSLIRPLICLPKGSNSGFIAFSSFKHTIQGVLLN